MRICRTIEIPSSGYYRWRACKVSNSRVSDEALYQAIKTEYDKSRKIYGSMRIEKALRQRGIKTSKKRVARIMNSHGLRSIVKQKFKATTNSNHSHAVSENIVQQKFSTERPNQVWTSDITYIWTSEGWIYLAVVLDIFSRQIIGWKISNSLNKEIVSEVIIKSVQSRRPSSGLVFHSDRGVQYASNEVRNILKNNSIRQSMSGKGNCYDNAITETFFHTLKTELVYQTSYRTRVEAEISIFEYIEVFYNRQRLHSAINFMAPIEYELQFYNIK